MPAYPSEAGPWQVSRNLDVGRFALLTDKCGSWCLGCTDTVDNGKHLLSFWVPGIWVPAREEVTCLCDSYMLSQRTLCDLTASVSLEGCPWVPLDFPQSLALADSLSYPVM